MSQNPNGNGGAMATLPLPGARNAAAPASLPQTETSIGENGVSFHTSEGVALRGTVARLQRHAVVFELYNPAAMPRLSEALADFKIVLQGGEIYSGRAVVHNIVNAGTKVVCETALDELCWQGFNLLPPLQWEEQLAAEFRKFLEDWRKSHRVWPEFKVVVADMQTFLQKLQAWLEQVQMKARDSAKPTSTKLEIQAAVELSPQVIQALDAFIGEFESIAAKISEDLLPDCRSYFRRQLHPLLLTSPFGRRAFDKPLGYAGDYQVIEMMFDSPYAGETLFAKIMNAWLHGQLLVQAHINRVAGLERKIVEETARVREKGRKTKILNVGCGPGIEVRRFFEKQHISQFADFTLVDFNQETLGHLRRKLFNAARHVEETASYRCVKKSVAEILKDRGKSLGALVGGSYDYIYCAGLFDYLPHDLCKQLMNLYYEILAPNGLLLVTNTAAGHSGSKPFLFSMDYILDWNLIYRDRSEFVRMTPDTADPDNVKVVAEDTGTNLFLEVRKPIDVR